MGSNLSPMANIIIIDKRENLIREECVIPGLEVKTLYNFLPKDLKDSVIFIFNTIFSETL